MASAGTVSAGKEQARPYSNKSPEGPWDAIVIGSGMGGMTTAATLAKLGQRVLVLEQHDVPGGFTHTFKRKRWVWDVGVHAIGEVSEQAMIGRVLRMLTDDRLRWTSLGGVYDEFHYPDLKIDFPDSKEAFVHNLHEAFPKEGLAVHAYLAKAKEVSTAMRGYYFARLLPPAWSGVGDAVIAREAQRFLTQTTAQALGGITQNKRLSSVLTAQWGYYGVPPERSSFAIHALVARHFLYGAFYPEGGSKKIADGLLATVANAGGWTRINASVREVIIEGGRAVGVRLDADERHGGPGEEIRAKRIVSAVGGIPTVERLLPAEERKQNWAQAIAKLKPTPCHLCVYLGFKGDIRKAGASASNKWFYESWNTERDTWDFRPEANEPEPTTLYCSFPSLKDPHHDPGPDQLHTGEIVTFVPYELFAKWKDVAWKRRGADYDALKQELTEKLCNQFFRHLPELKPLLEFAELSTPVSTEHFTRAAKGAIYGIEPTPERYRTKWLRPRTPIPGLYMSGGDMASVGVIGAMVGGLLCAMSMEPVRGVRLLREAVKQ